MLSLLMAATGFAASSKLDSFVARLKGADKAGRKAVMKSLTDADRKALHQEYRALSPEGKKAVDAALGRGKGRAKPVVFLVRGKLVSIGENTGKILVTGGNRRGRLKGATITVRPAIVIVDDMVSSLAGAAEGDRVVFQLRLPRATTATALPASGVTGADVDLVKFTQTLRGYKTSEVDWVLDRLGAELDQLRGELAAVQATQVGVDDTVDDAPVEGGAHALPADEQ